MTVKELIEELQKYPEDTKVCIENYRNDFWLTFIEEPWLEFKEEVRYCIDKDTWKKYYAPMLRQDWILKNVLFIE